MCFGHSRLVCTLWPNLPSLVLRHKETAECEHEHQRRLWFSLCSFCHPRLSNHGERLAVRKRCVLGLFPVVGSFYILAFTNHTAACLLQHKGGFVLTFLNEPSWSSTRSRAQINWSKRALKAHISSSVRSPGGFRAPQTRVITLGRTAAIWVSGTQTGLGMSISAGITTITLYASAPVTTNYQRGSERMCMCRKEREKNTSTHFQGNSSRY